ncbi:mis12 domain-containing protein [Stemphylium lycopersici]|uniref:Mis12 domain-containing protein n=1 Tax=Stemphylium lycopersici TaxID=183478 RepID=A0A364N4X4_STELY|nr:mis12 domain-containing protein [Stemphylium lycopersici]RAR11979.1 mis12 domain-containing protein [Stemphylium lycopersici]
MASAKQQENMLLTEHFSWPPISLIDDIINAINEVLYRCTDSFETGLSSADPALLGFSDLYASQNRTPEKDDDGNPVFPEARLEIEEGVLKLETLMENAVDKNFDKLEIWTLRNVFALGRGKGGDEGLGDWVRLGHYENIQPPSKDTHHLTPEALYTLRRKLIETQKLNAALVAEKTRNEAQIARLRALLQPPPTSSSSSGGSSSSSGTIAPKREARTSTSPSDATSTNEGGAETAAPFAFLTHTPAAQALGIQPNQQSASNKHLTTHTTFTTTQLPYLRQLLNSLKPHLATASLPANTTTSSSNAAAQAESSTERRIYVESQSKRILERRGVDVVDGVEGAWEGSRVRGDEVRGLEGLVEGMGRGGGKEGQVVHGAGDEGDAMDTS